MCKEWPARHCLLEVGHSYVGVPTRTANCLQKGLLLSIWRRKVAGACNPCVDLLVFTQYHTSCQAHRSEGEVELYMTRGGVLLVAGEGSKKHYERDKTPHNNRKRSFRPNCVSVLYIPTKERDFPPPRVLSQCGRVFVFFIMLDMIHSHTPSI